MRIIAWFTSCVTLSLVIQVGAFQLSIITNLATSRRRGAVEWPTLGVIAGCYLAFGALTWTANDLPWWLLLAVGGFVTCLFGSLQHEAVHGHPTANCRLNEALVFVPLNLWVPYRRYKRLHLKHHREDNLTYPGADPESGYLDPVAWDGAPKAVKIVYTINNSALGRLTIGPLVSLWTYIRADLKLLMRGDREAAVAWALHTAGTVPLAVWLIGVCDLALWKYVVLIAYPGWSLTLLRSYAEHRAHESKLCRTIIVESGPVMSLAFLNNNLHAAHHERPRLAWYRLPAYYRCERERLVQANCGYVMPGYLRLVQQYFLRPKEPVAHPLLERPR